MEFNDGAELLLKELDSVKDELIEYFSVQPRDPSRLELSKLARSLWVRLPEERILKAQAEASSLGVIAVDSSLQGEIYAHGRALYMLRSVAVSPWETRCILKVEFDASTKSRSITSVMRLLAETLEYKAALQLLRNTPPNSRTVVLLDGSLYVRLARTPVEYLVDRHRDAYLIAMEAFLELYEEALKRNAVIVGISKDSLSEHFKLALTRELICGILTQELSGKLSSKLAELPLTKLLSLTKLALGKESLSSNSKRMLRSLLRELHRRHSDFSFIMGLDVGTGFSTPMLLGCLRTRCLRRFNMVVKHGVVEAVRIIWRRHIRALQSLGTPSEARLFIRRASRILLSLKQIPAIITMYVMPREHDIPLRVDILPTTESPSLPSFYEFRNVRFTSANLDRLNLVLDIVLGGYADPRVYNTWLYVAHRAAKLTKKEFTALESFLRGVGLNLIPRRRRWVG